jgi:hypothetical protein
MDNWFSKLAFGEEEMMLYRFRGKVRSTIVHETVGALDRASEESLILEMTHLTFLFHSAKSI